MRLSGLRDSQMTESARIHQADVNREVVPPALWRLFVLIWLPFLYYPLLALMLAHRSPFQLVMTLAGAALFVILYLRLALPLPFSTADPSRLSVQGHLITISLTALLATDILVLTLLASGDWLWFFIFVSIALGARLPPRPAAVAIAATAALTVAIGVGAFGWVYALRIALPVAVVGLGMIGVGRLVATIRELRAAREEIARLAIAEERLRFARDLHDLLGHSLSAITLKNEVARSLVLTQPDRAVEELTDAIGLARTALREVRQAVSGYRQPSLSMEIRAARALLADAGIECSVDNEGSTTGETPLPPALDAMLAWTVREGVTNVVRHSGARHCAITIQRLADADADAVAVAVEIIDDGHGNDPASLDLQQDAPGHSGMHSGLRGLAERVAQVRGQIEAGPHEPSGYCLRVSAPLPVSQTLPADASADHPAEERVPQP